MTSNPLIDFAGIISLRILFYIAFPDKFLLKIEIHIDFTQAVRHQVIYNKRIFFDIALHSNRRNFITFYMTNRNLIWRNMAIRINSTHTFPTVNLDTHLIPIGTSLKFNRLLLIFIVFLLLERTINFNSIARNKNGITFSVQAYFTFGTIPGPRFLIIATRINGLKGWICNEKA